MHVAAAYGQNIVPNSSFEDNNTCEELIATCSPAAWFYITNNPIGYESGYRAISATGKKHLYLQAVRRLEETRQYWQTKLLCKLQPGERYRISVKIAARNPSVGPNAQDIGLYFTGRFLFSVKDTMLQPSGYISFSDARQKKLENGWVLLEKEFTASESRQFLVIGNFSHRTNKAILQERKASYAATLVDDVTIIPVRPLACPDSAQQKEMLYAYKKRHSIQGGIQLELPGTEKPRVDTLVISNIQFKFDSFKLLDTAMLQEFKSFFDKGDVTRVVVTGFTDDVGSKEYNLELSRKRASEIAALLKHMYHLPDSVMEAAGKGISNDFRDKGKNRRVEVYLYHR